MRTNEERIHLVRQRTAARKRKRARRKRRALDAACMAACLLLVAGVGAHHQFPHGFVGEHRERRRVHAADFHLVQGHLVHLQHEQYGPREVGVYQNELTRPGEISRSGQ